MGQAEETFTLPGGLREDLMVRARLLYRIASQKTVDSVMRKNAPKLPVVEMESASIKMPR